MKITFILTGSLKKSLLKEGFYEYIKRLKRYCGVEVIEIKDSPMGRKADGRCKGLREEARRINKRLDAKGAFRIALTEARGAQAFTSGGFAGFMEERLALGRDLVFIIGGAYGLDKSIVKDADMRLSLSPMTLPHEMAALVLAEQVYRAFTISRGEPYSH